MGPEQVEALQVPVASAAFVFVQTVPEAQDPLL